MDNNVADITTRKTLTKAMQILRAFSNDEPEFSVGSLSDRLDMHKSIVSRLVSDLCEWQMLERDPLTKKVRLGLGAFQLGMLVANQNPLHRLSLPLLGELVAKTRHTCHVSALDGTEMLVVASVQSPDALRVILRLGDRRPLHATAAGKVLLANYPDAKANAIIAAGLRRLTDSTITVPKVLREHFLKIRKDGVAWNEGESVAGAGAVAAPVFGFDGGAIGAISIVFPLGVVSASDRPKLSSAVKLTAKELSTALGWAPRKPKVKSEK